MDTNSLNYYDFGLYISYGILSKSTRVQNPPESKSTQVKIHPSQDPPDQNPPD